MKSKIKTRLAVNDMTLQLMMQEELLFKWETGEGMLPQTA